MLQSIWHNLGSLFAAFIAVVFVLLMLNTIREGLVSFRNRSKQHYDEETGRNVSSRDTHAERQAIGAFVVISFLISLAIVTYF